jgi:hypothetical protein
MLADGNQKSMLKPTNNSQSPGANAMVAEMEPTLSESIAYASRLLPSNFASSGDSHRMHTGFRTHRSFKYVHSII